MIEQSRNVTMFMNDGAVNLERFIGKYKNVKIAFLPKNSTWYSTIKLGISKLAAF